MKPILFSTSMVQAILRDEKTQTRRIIKKLDILDMISQGFLNNAIMLGKYRVNDILYVRETYMQIMRDHAHDLLEGRNENNLFVYKKQFHEDWETYAKEEYGYKWKPSIHMPKEAARIFLKVTDVRVERLQDITPEEAIQEGISIIDYVDEVPLYNNYQHKIGSTSVYAYLHPKNSFSSLWDSIYGKEEGHTWNDNPYVFVYDFEKIEKPIN